ncbi:unnamed protein product [Aphanomyces euteiches]|uniref:Uncharacterized protein n=1 Tax=Aphanomyces euteiches TaxID=100861 RepID=A0A6G0XS61_9STRA|nr:hypothetical protein Ae201684_001892 [Aphanomyces euteiches]KAH9089559.1 hypothetical protein Ae201684P_007727 [Aphanomyces euteiches]KAH9157449.1 hypothetical protein AeRB84_000695 [Aphanomyces euteiches]
MATAPPDDLTTYCFASPKDGSLGGPDRANGGICPAHMTVALTPATTATVGDNLQVSWTITLDDVVGSRFASIDPANGIAFTTLYLCSGYDHSVTCANANTELPQGRLTNGTFNATNSTSFNETIKLTATGSFSLMAQVHLLSSYSLNNVTTPSAIDFVAFRNIAVQAAPPESTSHSTVIALGIIGGLVAIALIMFFCWCCRSRQRMRTERQLASYAGAFIVRSRADSRSQVHGGRAISHYSAFPPQQDLLGNSDPPVTFDLKLTHYSEPSNSPLSMGESSVKSAATTNYDDFAMSPLVEDEIDFASNVSFSDLGAPESLDEGNSYSNYAISPLVDNANGFFTDISSGMEMVIEEEDDATSGNGSVRV